MYEEGYIEAYPRSPAEIAALSDCPEVLATAERKGIKNIVHFTRTNGAIGTLYAGALKSRKRLPDDQMVKSVYEPNAKLRMDTPWLDYVNLSIERINDWMFAASKRWHLQADDSWVVLSFHPKILTHPGVVFTTTNNKYPECRRAEGLKGFQRMFSDSVTGYQGRMYNRADKQTAWPTDRQAEALYPSELACSYLQRIDVQLEETVDTMHGILGGLKMNIPVRYAPEAFR